MYNEDKVCWKMDSKYVDYTVQGIEKDVRTKVKSSYCLNPEMIEVCTVEKKERLKNTLQSSFKGENKMDDAVKFTFRYLNQCIESFFKPLCGQCKNRKHPNNLI